MIGCQMYTCSPFATLTSGEGHDGDMQTKENAAAVNSVNITIHLERDAFRTFTKS